MRLYAEISKVEEQDDGTIKVSGIASSETIDAAGETITADAMRGAIPDYMAFGAIREMHDSKKAAGTALECSVGDDGRTYLEALVVDPIAIKKVQTGVYKGFSVGGKALKRNGTVIEQMKLVEISLVDRPCNPEAIFSIAKVEAEVEKSEQVEALQKSMGEVWDAQAAIQACVTLCYLIEVEQGEGEPEGVAQVALLKEALQKLKEFIASEIMEESHDDIQASDLVDDIAKAGRAFSAKNLAKLESLHKMCQESHDALGKAMGEFGKVWAAKEEEDEEGEKKEEPKDEEKVRYSTSSVTGPQEEKSAQSDDIQKLMAEKEDAIAKVQAEKTEALGKVAALEAALAAKNAEKPLRAVTVEKSEDVGKVSEDIQKAIQGGSELDIMKAVLAHGGRRTIF